AAGSVAPAGGVVEERKYPAGGVKAAGGVDGERPGPGGGVKAAGGVETERVGAESSVIKPVTRRYCLSEAGGERIGSPGSVELGIADGRVQHGLPPARGGGQHQHECSRYCHERSDWLHRSLRAPDDPAKKH